MQMVVKNSSVRERQKSFSLKLSFIDLVVGKFDDRGNKTIGIALT